MLESQVANPQQEVKEQGTIEKFFDKVESGFAEFVAEHKTLIKAAGAVTGAVIGGFVSGPAAPIVAPLIGAAFAGIAEAGIRAAENRVEADKVRAEKSEHGDNDKSNDHSKGKGLEVAQQHAVQKEESHQPLNAGRKPLAEESVKYHNHHAADALAQAGKAKDASRTA